MDATISGTMNWNSAWKTPMETGPIWYKLVKWCINQSPVAHYDAPTPNDAHIERVYKRHLSAFRGRPVKRPNINHRPASSRDTPQSKADRVDTRNLRKNVDFNKMSDFVYSSRVSVRGTRGVYKLLFDVWWQFK